MTLCPNSAEHIFPQFKLYLTVIGKMFDRKRNFPVIHADRKSVFDTVPEFMDMKTGMHRMQSYIMWEVVRVDPDIIISRPDILPEIIFI